MLLELQSVHGGYGKKEIIKGVDFHADHGDIVCLAGPNGCGKTTLFRLILGSLPLSDGHIFIDGTDIQTLSPKERANLIAYIPQYHTPIFSYTALEVVIMGRASHFSAFKMPKSIDRQAAFHALEKVNALHLANRPYTSLSGGQRQLILIARAICQSAKILIMDEPAASLDYANQQRLTYVIRSCTKWILYHHVHSQPGTYGLSRQPRIAYERWKICFFWNFKSGYHTTKPETGIWN